MWTVKYQYEGNGRLETIEERWSSLSAFRAHTERCKEWTDNFRIIAVKDPMGRLHNRHTAMKRGF